MNAITICLGALGLIATIAFGVVLMKSRYPGKLTFIKEDIIDLFDSIVKNLPNLSILYKGSAVNQNLVLLKGAILNTGDKDISPEMIEGPLQIKLPKNFKWLEAKVISTSKDVDAEIAITEDRIITLNTKLFRRDEVINFEVLAEVPQPKESKGKKVLYGKTLEKSIRFSHRIADTGGVNKKTIFEDIKPLTIKRLLPILAVSMVGIILMLVSLLNKDLNLTFVYQFKAENGEVIEVIAQPKNDRTVKLRGVQERYYNKIPMNKFFSRVAKTPKIAADPIARKSMLFGGIIYIIFPLLVIMLKYWEKRRNQRLKKILSGGSEKLILK